jgi:Predicted integral membrane protein
MITNGFTYVAFLIFFAGSLVLLEKKTHWKIFEYIPPVVMLYLGSMLLCTAGLWDMKATQPAYGALKNNLLYAMVFVMLLRCDIRKILKLGPRMLGGFFAASITICIGFIGAYALFHTALGAGAWKALGALCGSWLGGSGNMIAIQAALDINSGDMAYALVVDSIDYSIWVMFLLWAVSFAPKFNKWTNADTSALDEVCARLEADELADKGTISFASMIFLLGFGLIVSAIAQNFGVDIQKSIGILDKATWTVLIVTVLGLIVAVTPLARITGSAEISNVLLYSIIALLASRASFAELRDAPIWIITGFVILGIHAVLLIAIAKIFKLDMFTCGVASLANIGGTASAPILAGSYSGALVPVGVLMALMGYAIGTGGGLIVAHIMSMFG